ncbi:MAG: Translation initiation factor [Verrucomicrobiota bacterium]|jgi:translation initiation factor IF-1
MENTITTTATIIGPYSDIFEATLPNGKKTLAHFSRTTAHLRDQVRIGMKVTVELTPFDFDVARIVAIDDSSTPPLPKD